MTLTKERDTKRREHTTNEDPVAANQKIYAGALVCLKDGKAVKGAVAADLVARGRALHTVDNTGGTDGAKTIRTDVGIFLFDNHGTDTITRTHIGKDAWIVDDHTVAATGAPASGSNTRSKAGRIVDLEGGRVWVEVR